MAEKRKRKSTLQILKFSDNESSLFGRQYLLLTAVLVLVLLVYVLRLWHLQILEGPRYRYQSENNRIRLEDIPAPRGIIFDRNGIPLVENRPAYHLELIREDVADLEETVQRLARLCERDPQEFLDILESNRHRPRFKPVRLLADLDRDILARVEAHRVRLPGVVLQLEPKREYRWNGVAAHLIGYLSEITEQELSSPQFEGYHPGEDIGRYGVERAYQRYLHGRRGGRQVEVDALGRRMRLLEEVLPIPGRNIWLTIDIELQKAAEEALKGETGSIVAMDPRDGAILALASSPTFDQENFIRGFTREEWRALSNDPGRPLLNRAIGAAYPPGSVYKPFLLLAGLNEGVISLDTKFNCPGFYFFANRRYRCWRDQGHGNLDAESSLVQSCNVFYYQTGMRLGVDRIAHYSKLFGMGTATGISLHGEHPGLIPTADWKRRATGVPWQRGETLSVSIGQGFNLTTPLQMALSYSALANGGKVWQPYVVRRIEGGGTGGADEMRGNLKRKVHMDPRHLDMVRSGLKGVVHEDRGTAHRAVKDKSLSIAGKTGTALVVRLPDNVNRKLHAREAKRRERDHAWFVGYAPADDPQITVVAMVEHGGHGSSAAAPRVEQVMAAHFKGVSREEDS